MATAVEERNVLLLAQELRAEERPDSSPQSLETLLQGKGHVMQDPSQTVTNFALAQGWSFAGVTADPASAGLASLESVQPSPEQDTDAAVLAKSQEPAPEAAIASMSGSEVTRTEGPAQESLTTEAAAETPSSNDTRTLVSVKDEESESDDEGGDILAAIRRRQSKSVQPARPAEHQASPFPSGAPATNTPVNSAVSRQKAIPSHNSVNDGTKNIAKSRTPIGATRSSFLAKYSYAGTKRQGPSDEKGEHEEPKHSRKRPSPEVIDLTDVPDNPSQPTASSPREGKRRRLDKHGREKRSKAERADSQVHDDALKKSASRSLLGRKDRKDARSSASHKSKKSRRKHRRERHQERERERLQKPAQPTSNESLPGAPPDPRQVKLQREQRIQRLLSTRQAGGQQNAQEARPQPRQGPSQETGSVELQLPHLPQPPRPQNLNGNHPNATHSRGQEVSQNLRPGLQPEPRPQPLPERTRGIQHGLLRNQPALANRVIGSTINAASISGRETINAIKHRQPTVADKARSKIQEINKKAAERAQENIGHLSVSDLENDADLFQHFASKVPQKRSTELISSLPKRTERLAPNNNLHRGNELPSLPPPPLANGGRQVSNLAQSRNIFAAQPASQSRLNTQTRAEMQLKELHSSGYVPLPLRRAQQQQQQRALPPFPPSEDDDQPIIQTRTPETVSAIEALGPDRTVVQYVVYRTPRFTPPCSGMTTDQALLEQVKKEKAIRCSEHLALAQANSQAAARQDRPRKGVVGKGWSMVKSTLSSSFSSPSSPSSSFSSAVAPGAASGSGTAAEPGPTSNPNSAESAAQPAPHLYSGQVAYDNGEIQLFWVGEETRDLGAAVPGVAAADMARAGGWVQVDKAGVEVYRRKRFDVWSRVYWGTWKEKPSGGGGQKVVFECGEGQEGKDTDGERRGNDGEEVGEEVGKVANGEGENGDDEGMAVKKSAEERSERGRDGERDENEDKGAGVEDSTQNSERGRDGEVEQNGDDNGMEAKKTIEENSEEAQRAGASGTDETAVGAERHDNGAQHEDDHEDEHEAGDASQAKTGAGRESGNEGKDKETPTERREKEAEAEAAKSNEQRPADTTAQRIRRWQESQGLRKPKTTKKQKADKAADETDSDDSEDESEDDEPRNTTPQNPQSNATPQDPPPVNRAPSSSAPGSTTITIELSEGKSIVDLVDTVPKLHGTYTTLVHANRAALSTFLALTKPRNRSITDNYYYQDTLEPNVRAQFEEEGWGRSDCTSPIRIPWDTPTDRPHKWGFLRVVVEVVESELMGPVDLGDMVVEGGGGNGSDGKPTEGDDEAVKGPREVNGLLNRKESEVVNVRAAEVRTLPSPIEEELEGEVSEEE